MPEVSLPPGVEHNQKVAALSDYQRFGYFLFAWRISYAQSIALVENIFVKGVEADLIAATAFFLLAGRCQNIV